MVKRAASSLLWLFAVVWALNFTSAFSGIPPMIGPAVAIAIATFVGVDPLHLIWPVTAPSSATDRREVAAVNGRVPSQS